MPASRYATETQDADICVKVWADYYVLTHTHPWELVKSVGNQGYS